MQDAAARGAENRVLSREAYLPGLRGLDFEVPPFDKTDEDRALRAVAEWSRAFNVATILGMEHITDGGPADCVLRHRRRGERLQGVSNEELSSTRARIDSTCPGTRGACSRSTA